VSVMRIFSGLTVVPLINYVLMTVILVGVWGCVIMRLAVPVCFLLQGKIARNLFV
jgi:hypothetical protein